MDKGPPMAKKSKYRTVSLLNSIAEEIERLIEELGFWPSVSAFVREACLEKIREERRRLREQREAPGGSSARNRGAP